MQFCSNEYPVRARSRAACAQLSATSVLKALCALQEKLAGSAGQTGSLNTFLNGKLTTKPLKVRRGPRARRRWCRRL